MMRGAADASAEPGRRSRAAQLHLRLGRNQCPAASAHRATRGPLTAGAGGCPSSVMSRCTSGTLRSQGCQHSQGAPTLRLLTQPHRGAPLVGTRGSSLRGVAQQTRLSCQVDGPVTPPAWALLEGAGRWQHTGCWENESAGLVALSQPHLPGLGCPQQAGQREKPERTDRGRGTQACRWGRTGSPPSPSFSAQYPHGSSLDPRSEPTHCP